MAISDRLLQLEQDNQGVDRFPLAGLRDAADELEGRLGQQGAWDASAGTFPGAGAAYKGNRWRVGVAGTVAGVAFAAGDVVEALIDNAAVDDAAHWFKHNHAGQAGGAGDGDMDAATYDPGNVAADAFDMANMAEAADAKVMTAAERAAIESLLTEVAALANGMVYKGVWDASVGTFPGGGAAQTGWLYHVSVGGTVDGVEFTAGDNVVAVTDDASTATYAGNWQKHDQTDAVQSVAGLVGSISASALLAALNIQADDVAFTPGASGLAAVDAQAALVELKALLDGKASTSHDHTNLQPKSTFLDQIVAATKAPGDTLEIDGSGAPIFNPPGGSTKIGAVIEDETPELGGMLIHGGHGIGDGTRKVLDFTDTANAVNFVEMVNAASGEAPVIRPKGPGPNCPLILTGLGTDPVVIPKLSVSAVLDLYGDQVIKAAPPSNIAFLAFDFGGTGAPAWFEVGLTHNTIVRGPLAPQEIIEAATIPVDMHAGANFYVTLTASRILGNVANPYPGSVMAIRIIQGGAGGHTLGYESGYHFDGAAPALSTAAGAQDLLVLYPTNVGTTFARLQKGFAAP